MFCYYLLFCWKIDLLLAENNEHLIPSLEQAPTSNKLPLLRLKIFNKHPGCLINTVITCWFYWTCQYGSIQCMFFPQAEKVWVWDSMHWHNFIHKIKCKNVKLWSLKLTECNLLLTSSLSRSWLLWRTKKSKKSEGTMKRLLLLINN